eukprot:c20830_g1_i1.p1 GENE.c20830_g1_i1~~c20830_g1_i1.p1  ORF type:complete len:1181 (+),score=578.18 c20830_g1_i1:19-3561(+)
MLQGAAVIRRGQKPSCITRSLTSTTNNKHFHKIMCANRGEIAIRVFRAAKELGRKTVGIYSSEDMNALHRSKADEAYHIGKGLAPVDAYLSIADIIRAAKAANVDAIHPGYGFLSERGEFAQACVDNGITWIGPPPNVVHQAGNKMFAKKMAQESDVPSIPGLTTPVSTLEAAQDYCEKVGYPVMLKAAHGGGGRGIRPVFSRDELKSCFERATSEALLAFGSSEMFIEKLILNPRHIEVQVMGDKYGNVVHLFERDCSVQRRNQKLVEIAPAPYLDPAVRQRIVDSAVRLCKKFGYENAGTVEFLLDSSGQFYFMEVNARLQVEHTVTEQITGFDLVQCQIKVAEGKSLEELGLIQSQIQYRGCAIQVRVTTENPKNNFTPDTGKVARFESGEGVGIRLDSSCGGSGHVVTPHYDSLLCKVIGSGRDHIEASTRLARALKEFKIDGLSTNIPFLVNVLTDPVFLNGPVTTKYIEENPHLLNISPKPDPRFQVLNLLADMVVNGPITPLGTPLKPAKITPVVPDFDYAKYAKIKPQGLNLKYILNEQGPTGFAKAVRQHKGLLVTDTTWRDAHQSLLATRVRTQDILNVAYETSHLLGNCYSLENWGGATFDVALRFLYECPWERLALMREKVPNIPFQMLLRGANTLGYTSYPDNVVKGSVKLAVQHGMDVFRIFDSLNYFPNLQLGIDAVGEAGGVVEAAICYTGDVANPNRTKYNLEYYLKLAHQLVNHGIHVLCIKDMAGLLKPQAATILISALRREFPDVPIHVHTHDTSGAGVASMIAAAAAGADAVDCALDSMSGLTSQPSFGALVASVQGTNLDTGISLDSISKLSTYWEQARGNYAPFECTETLKATNADVYEHEIPGGQYTNLQFQAYSLGLLDQWPLIKKKYQEANLLLGDIIKVTPSSKVVGDLAQFMVQNHLSIEDVQTKAAELSFPSSVLDFLSGGMGQPYGGYPAWRDAALKGKKVFTGRPGDDLKPLDFDALRAKLQAKNPGREFSDADIMSAALYPAVFDDYAKMTNLYGQAVTYLPTQHFFCPLEVGESTTVEFKHGLVATYKLISVSELNKSTGKREVVFEMNGYPVFLSVYDTVQAKTMGLKEKADPSNHGSVGAPMPGNVVSVKVTEGQKVHKGDPLVVVSAMKMETVVSAPITGEVVKVNVKNGDTLQGGDLIVLLKA